MPDSRSQIEQAAGAILRTCEDPAIVAQAIQALGLLAVAQALEGLGQTLDQVTRDGRLQADLRLENEGERALKVEGEIRLEKP